MPFLNVNFLSTTPLLSSDDWKPVLRYLLLHLASFLRGQISAEKTGKINVVNYLEKTPKVGEARDVLLNNLKSKLYTNFRKLADSPRVLKLGHRFRDFGFKSLQSL